MMFAPDLGTKCISKNISSSQSLYCVRKKIPISISIIHLSLYEERHSYIGQAMISFKSIVQQAAPGDEFLYSAQVCFYFACIPLCLFGKKPKNPSDPAVAIAS